MNHANGLWAEPADGRGRRKFGSGAHFTAEDAFAAQVARCQKLLEDRFMWRKRPHAVDQARFWLHRNGQLT